MRALTPPAPSSPRSVRSKAAATVPETLAELLASLVADDGSVRRLDALLPRILDRADGLPVDQRYAWQDGLRRLWRRQAWALSQRHRADLMTLTAAWGDWPLTRAIGHVMESSHGLTAQQANCLVVACRQLGEVLEASDRCRSRMLAHPRESWPEREYHALIGLIEFHTTIAGPIESPELRLEPLGHHHDQDFACQFYDPTIAERCCLPDFPSDEHWHHWLDDCWAIGDQRLYAVIDPEWGFVGSVSLVLHAGIGFVYYWIGRDFQGRGLATAAVRLLLDAASVQDGMRACYAKVFEDNTRSQRVLERLGFQALDICPSPPDEAERFYRLGPPQMRERTVEDLHELFARMRSDTRVAAPMAAHSGDIRTLPSRPRGRSRMTESEIT